MTKRTCLAIVLAAGEGTRMRSATPKVMHEVAGRSLLGHVLGAVRGAGRDARGRGGRAGPEAVEDEAQARAAEGASSSCRRSGSGPRMRCSRRGRRSRGGADDILVIFGDTPLMQRRDAEAAARRIDHEAQRRRARLPPGRSGRLRAADHATASSSSRSARSKDASDRSSAGSISAMAALMALARRAWRSISRPHRQRQRQGRILSDRRRRPRERAWR